MQLTNKQNDYIKNAMKRWNFKIGAVRSGKTFVDQSYVIPSRIRERKDLDGLNVIMGVTQQTVERNVLEPMRKVYGSFLVGHIQKTTNKVNLFGDVAYVVGMEKANAINVIQGASFKYVYGDEIAKWNKEAFAMLKSRLDKPYSCFDGTANPEFPTHWLKEFLDSDADIYLQEYIIDDNTFLDSAFIDNLKKEYFGTVYYDRYILGKWVLAEGRIYKVFDDKNIIKYEDWYARDNLNRYTHPVRKRLMYVNIGLDFGGNKSKHSLQATAVTKNFQEIITIKSKRFEPKDTRDLESVFIAFVRELLSEGYMIHEINVDSAEQVLRRTLQQALLSNRLNYKVSNAVKGEVNDRIQFYLSMMNQLRYYVLDSCVSTIEAFNQAVWDERKQDDVRLDNGTTDIDTLDAQEYTTERLQKIMIKIGGSTK